MGRLLERTLFVVFCTLAFVGTLLAQSSDNPNREETADSADLTKAAAAGSPYYIIEPNDVLEIYVWKEPELTRKVLVRPDGRISFPLVQDLQVAGMSPLQIKQDI